MSAFYANPENYSDFKTLVQFAGINSSYCLYYTDSSPSFAVTVFNPTASIGIMYKGSVSVPTSFSTDFPNSLQIGTWPLDDISAGTTTFYAYSDFKNVINYLSAGGRILYWVTTGPTVFHAVCYSIANAFNVSMYQSGGVPSTFLTDFPNAIQLNGPF